MKVYQSHQLIGLKDMANEKLENKTDKELSELKNRITRIQEKRDQESNVILNFKLPDIVLEAIENSEIENHNVTVAIRNIVCKNIGFDIVGEKIFLSYSSKKKSIRLIIFRAKKSSTYNAENINKIFSLINAYLTSYNPLL